MAESLTEDMLLGGRVRLAQPAEGYRAAIDPVLLAAAIPARADDEVLDVGAGAGAASLCLAARVPGCRVTGLERAPWLARLATENAAASGLQDRVAFVAGDLLDPPAGVVAGRFAQVMANPPYMPAARASPPHPAKEAATVEGAADLARWIEFCLRMVRPRGAVTLIHRADRLDELLAALQGRAGRIVVFPLWPSAGRDAKRVILQARKGIAGPTRLAAGLALHDPSGGYTAEAEAVLRHGKGLEL